MTSFSKIHSKKEDPLAPWNLAAASSANTYVNIFNKLFAGKIILDLSTANQRGIGIVYLGVACYLTATHASPI